LKANRTVLLGAALALLWGGSGIMAADATPGFRLVVSPESSLTSLRRAEVARIFLRKQSRWKDGRDALPVDQSARSPVRAAFSKDVLAVEGLEKISAVEGYWRQQIFSGRGTPPAIKASDAEVLQYVASTPGAVGYVSESASVAGVKTLTVKD